MTFSPKPHRDTPNPLQFTARCSTDILVFMGVMTSGSQLSLCHCIQTSVAWRLPQTQYKGLQEPKTSPCDPEEVPLGAAQLVLPLVGAAQDWVPTGSKTCYSEEERSVLGEKGRYSSKIAKTTQSNSPSWVLLGFLLYFLILNNFLNYKCKSSKWNLIDSLV